MDLPRREEVAAQEKCAQAARETAPVDRSKQRVEYGDDRGEDKSDVERLAGILRSQSANQPARYRWLDTSPPTGDAAPSRQAASLWTHPGGSPTVAQPLVCQARAVQSGTRRLRICLASIPRPLTGEPDAGNPPVRFGGRGGVQTSIPTPILSKDGHNHP